MQTSNLFSNRRNTSVIGRPENWLLIAYFAALAVQSMWGASRGIVFSGRVETVDQFALSIIIAYWVMCDSERRGEPRPFVFGMLLYIAWPLIAPFHLWKTRRWRALITVVIFIGFAILSTLPIVIHDLMDVP